MRHSESIALFIIILKVHRMQFYILPEFWMLQWEVPNKIGWMEPQTITLQSTSEWLLELLSLLLPTQNAVFWRRIKGINSCLWGSCLFLLMHSRIFHSRRDHHVFSKLIAQKRTTGGFQEEILSWPKNYVSTLKFIIIFFLFIFFL